LGCRRGPKPGPAAARHRALDMEQLTIEAEQFEYESVNACGAPSAWLGSTT
jgi:hypothetical protein